MTAQKGRALDSAPRWALLQLMKRRESLSVDEAVTELGASKTAVRSHLLRLEEGGWVERVRASAGGAGRPPLTYRVSAEGHALFPTSDGEVLAQLLAFLETGGKKELIVAFFENYWKARSTEYEEELASQSGDPSQLSTRLAALSAVLDRRHFMPDIRVTSSGPDGVRKGDSRGAGVTVRECNCPYPETVRATRLPCRFETDFLSRIVGVAPSEVRYLSRDRGACVFRFDGVPLTGGSRRARSPIRGRRPGRSG